MIAVILFPGLNCENESKDVIEALGLQAEIVRWNEPVEKLSNYDGYIIPGGWSYEDRIRAGVIAAKSNVMSVLKEQAKAGKPIIGICNGCQILIESGIVPELGMEKVEFATAPNDNPKVSGFYCTWINLKKVGDCVFTKGIDDVTAMPIAHGEGRFTTANPEILKELEKNGQIIFKYCTPDGEVKNEFPTNPNGTTENIAAISNKEGNVLAIMPHPERASFKRQLKLHPLNSFEEGESFAPAIKIFQAMKDFLQSKTGGA